LKKLKLKGRLWLKSFHVFFAAAWIGGAISLIVLPLVSIYLVKNPNYTHAINLAIKFIDIFVTIPAAIGSIITGFMLSLLTNWGFFKHKWVTLKWIITSVVILVGAIWIGPWISDLIQMSASPGFNRLENQTYQATENKYIFLHTSQTLLLIYLVFMSIFKPWKKAK